MTDLRAFAPLPPMTATMLAFVRSILDDPEAGCGIHDTTAFSWDERRAIHVEIREAFDWGTNLDAFGVFSDPDAGWLEFNRVGEFVSPAAN